MDALSVLVLATQCGSGAPAPILTALAIAQTDGAPFAIIVDNELKIQPTIEAAVQAAASGLIHDSVVRVGIAGLPTTEFDKRNLSYPSGFSACRNLSVAGLVLRKRWTQLGAKEADWRLAAIEIAQGKTDHVSDFAKKFDAAFLQVAEAEHELSRLSAAVPREQSSPALGDTMPHLKTSQSDSGEPHATPQDSDSVMVFKN